MRTSKSMAIGLERELYLEDLIPGYTTIDVKGRESIQRDITATDVGIRDGSIYRYKKYGTRILTVSFVIEGKDSTELLSKVDQLNSVLDMEETEFIFDDEDDKFYVGTVNGQPAISIATPGGSDFGVASGSFEILCSDPFKYGVIEHVQEFEDYIDDLNVKRLSINYEGTRESYPVFEGYMYNCDEVLDMQSPDGTKNVDYLDVEEYAGDQNEEVANKSNCGYVAFMDDMGSILQFGNPNIEAESDYKKSQAFDPSAVYYLFNDSDQVYEVASPQPTTQEQWAQRTYYIPIEESQVLDMQLFNNSGCYSDAVKSKWGDSLPSGFSLPSGYSNVGQVGYAMGYDQYSVDQNGAVTSGTLWKGSVSESNKSTFTYTITAKAYDRTASTCKVDITINWTKSKKSTFRKKGTLVSSFSYYDDSSPYDWQELPGSSKTLISASKSYTKAAASGSATCKLVFNDLSSSQTKLNKRLQFKVVASNGGYGGKSATVCEEFYIPSYLPPQNGTFYLKANTVSNNTDWNGPTVTRFLSEGASDFEFNTELYFACGNASNSVLQRGACQVLLVGGSNYNPSTNVISDPYILAGFNMYDDDAAKTTGTLKYYINGDVKNIISDINLNYNDVTDYITKTTSKTVWSKKKKTGYKYDKKKKQYYKTTTTTTTTTNFADARRRSCSITKFGSTFTFKIAGESDYIYTADEADSLDGANVYAVVIGFFQKATYPVFDWIGLKSTKFIKNNCSLAVGVPNPFSIGDVLVADTSDNSFTVNGTSKPALGALGNDWETIALSQGENTYSVACSIFEKVNPPMVYRKCRGRAYIQCNQGDWDSDQTYYVLNNGVYSSVATPTQEVFEATYSSYFMIDFIDEFDPNQQYYELVGGEYEESYPTRQLYESVPYNYYVLEECIPKFRMRYREGFL